MKKLLLMGVVGVLMAFSLMMAGCGITCDNNGACRVMTNQNADGAYEVCSVSSCAVSKVAYPVPENTNVKCDCK